MEEGHIGKAGITFLATLLAFVFAVLAVLYQDKALGLGKGMVGFLQPEDNAVVVNERVRFLFVTDRMLRIEWLPPSMDPGSFEDRPSLIFAHRDSYLRQQTELPRVSVEEQDELLIISTAGLVVTYGSQEQPWTTAPKLTATGCLSVRQLELDFEWQPGMKPLGNLFGTVRTLDQINGATPLELGLLSRNGWSLIDESQAPLLESDGEGMESRIPWAFTREASKDYLDWTFMGYGHQYRTALADYVAVAGRIPLPPKFAFGSYWSRWQAYSDKDLVHLVESFRKHRLPLDVLVIDMDWHLTAYNMMNMGYVDLAGQPLGWTGYTWNRTLFPDPKRFLDWCHDHGLRTTLNLHPAAGIQPFEETYSDICKAMGLEALKDKHVPFEIEEPKFAKHYFEQVLRKLEGQGVDFFWLDWQQHNTTAIKNLNPTIWLNHVFFNDMERRRKEDNRGLILHRWGGLGSHRYQVGFSGDTWITWESLDFQIYFTSTAANVGFGFWSHDIGGFMSRAETEPELFLRWIQWGALSPMFRTHAWRVPWIERRMWTYGDLFPLMREAVLLRYSLIPYIYTESRTSHETGVAIVYPLYYDWPETEEAYTFKSQYMLGSSILVSPIVARALQISEMATKQVWLPPGEWIEWHSLTSVEGPSVHSTSACLDEIPIYVKAGSIIPMMVPGANIAASPDGVLIVSVFPGRSGSAGKYTLYEDDGESKQYKSNGFGHTTITAEPTDEKTWRVIVGSRRGSFEGAPKERSIVVRLVGLPPPQRVSINGEEIQGAFEAPDPGYQWTSSRKPWDALWESWEEGAEKPIIPNGNSWSFEPNRLSLVVYTSLMSVDHDTVVEVEFEPKLDMPTLYSGAVGRVRRAHKVADLLGTLATTTERSEAISALQGVSLSSSTNVDNFAEEVLALDSHFSKAMAAVESLGSTRTTMAALALLKAIVK